MSCIGRRVDCLGGHLSPIYKVCYLRDTYTSSRSYNRLVQYRSLNDVGTGVLALQYGAQVHIHR